MQGIVCTAGQGWNSNAVSEEDFMKFFTFLGIGFTVTFSIIFVNFLSVLSVKADKQDDWWFWPLLQNTLLAIMATTYLIAYNIGLW